MLLVMFQHVFKTQHAAQVLGASLSDINDEAVRNLEQEVCDFSLNPEAVNISQLKADLAGKLNCANTVVRNYDAYEKAARATSDGTRLSNAQVQQTFSDINMVIEGTSLSSIGLRQASGKDRFSARLPTRSRWT